MDSQVFFIYCGKVMNGTTAMHEYRIAALLEQNDGRSVGEMRVWHSDKAMWRGGIGAMYECTLKSETNVSYSSKKLPSGWWKNREDVSGWQLRTASVDGQLRMKDNPHAGNLEEMLKPIRDIYFAGSRIDRRMVLAEIIRIITT